MTNNQSADHERPPTNQERRNVLGENLLTVVTIIGVIGELAILTIGIVNQSIIRWHGIWTYLKKFRQHMDGARNHVHSVSRWSVFKDVEMSHRTTYCIINYQCYWRFRLKSIKENRIEVRHAFSSPIATLLTSRFRSIVYYFTTTVCAVILGIILVTVIRPGDGHNTNLKADQKVTRDVLTADTLLDLVRWA